MSQYAGSVAMLVIGLTTVFVVLLVIWAFTGWGGAVFAGLILAALVWAAYGRARRGGQAS